MPMAAKDVLDQALRLSLAERSEIVRELIRSLDAEEGEDPDEVERAWAAELVQRAERALRGEPAGRDLATVCDELEAKRRPKT